MSVQSVQIVPCNHAQLVRNTITNQYQLHMDTHKQEPQAPCYEVVEYKEFESKEELKITQSILQAVHPSFLPYWHFKDLTTAMIVWRIYIDIPVALRPQG